MEARHAFEQARQIFPNADKWHIFYAGPAPVGVVIGQQINPTMYPRTQLYEYRHTGNSSLPSQYLPWRKACLIRFSDLLQSKGDGSISAIAGRSRDEIFQSIMADIRERSDRTMSDAEVEAAARYLITFVSAVIGHPQEEGLGTIFEPVIVEKQDE